MLRRNAKDAYNAEDNNCSRWSLCGGRGGSSRHVRNWWSPERPGHPHPDRRTHHLQVSQRFKESNSKRFTEANIEDSKS